MSLAAAELAEVELALGGRPVLRGVSATLADGEITALLGPNGAGKSSLLRLLAGTLAPSAGRVTVFGRQPADYARAALARLVAVVPQATSIPFAFRVREVVAMGRAPHVGLLGLARPADHRAVAAAMVQAGVAALAARPFDQLSGGEQQRVIVARALAQEPRLLLLDEATAHLDLHHSERIMDLVAELNRRARLAVVLVTHDPNLAARRAGRVLMLAEGRLVAGGRPAEVLTPELLARYFGCRAAVVTDPFTGGPHIVLGGAAA